VRKGENGETKREREREEKEIDDVIFFKKLF
jgi:hypothetical protein